MGGPRSPPATHAPPWRWTTSSTHQVHTRTRSYSKTHQHTRSTFTSTCLFPLSLLSSSSSPLFLLCVYLAFSRPHDFIFTSWWAGPAVTGKAVIGRPVGVEGRQRSAQPASLLWPPAPPGTLPSPAMTPDPRSVSSYSHCFGLTATSWLGNLDVNNRRNCIFRSLKLELLDETFKHTWADKQLKAHI